jgi:ACS family hexuronate transporter-like MFS transporter
MKTGTWRRQSPMTGIRWVVVALLFFATVINYVDRAVLGILKPVLEKELGWDQVDYGWIVTAFQVTYAAGYVLGGRLFDQIGVRLGYLLAVTVWSVAEVSHAFVRSVTGFSLARAGLGIAEGGNFPAAIKTVTEWFPRQQRAFATGLFNAGSNIGAVLCPLAVPWLAHLWGWQSAFLATGGLGFLWVAVWLAIYRAPDRHPMVSPDELAYIRSDPPDPPVKIPWSALLRHRQTWAFMVGMLMSSPIWWFYIYWIPDFLNKQYHLRLTQSSGPLVAIFLVADGGGIAGGWLSSALIGRGWSVNASRKVTLLICGLCVLPVFLTPLVSSLWVSVALVALAASAHCGFAANLFTLVSDTVPQQVVSSVVGIGGMAGSIGGIVFAQAVSRILQATGNNYMIPFAIASMSYLVALAIMHLLLPRLEPMKP